MSEPRLLRQMEYGELFNEAFDLYKRNFLLLAGIGALVYVPYYLAAAFLAAYPLVLGIIVLVLIMPFFAASGAVVKALADRYLGREATIAGSWRYILRRMVPYSLTGMLATLLITGGLVLFCVPGIIVAFWVYFVWAVMIVEDRYYTAAIRRSRELAAGQWLRIFVVVLLTLVLMMGIYLVIAIVAGILMFPVLMRGGPAHSPEQLPMAFSMIQSLVSGVLQTVITPFTSVLSVLLYFDVRIRKEGFDIELLAQEMGEPPPGAGPAFDLS
jgi:hypothetical protein